MKVANIMEKGGRGSEEEGGLRRSSYHAAHTLSHVGAEKEQDSRYIPSMHCQGNKYIGRGNERATGWPASGLRDRKAEGRNRVCGRGQRLDTFSSTAMTLLMC